MNNLLSSWFYWWTQCVFKSLLIITIENLNKYDNNKWLQINKTNYQTFTQVKSMINRNNIDNSLNNWINYNQIIQNNKLK